MSDRLAEQVDALVRGLARQLHRKLSEVLALLFNPKNTGSLGAIAGFAIAVIFAWKFLRSPPARPRQNRPKLTGSGQSAQRVASEMETAGRASKSKDADASESIGSPIQLTMRQIVRKKLSGCRKMTCQLLGVILEERTPEELQQHATVRPSAVEVLLEISKHCDLYLMETILDDESEERVLSAMESAGLFQAGGLIKEKVLFCSTEIGRTSFVRQLESDLHVDTNLDIISHLSRFIRSQIYISSMEAEQIAPNASTSSSLEHYFS